MDNQYKHEALAEEPQDSTANGGKDKETRGLSLRRVDRYIRYFIFLVAIGLVYVWNSNVAERQVRLEQKLKHEISDAKARFKTIHARFSNDSRRSVMADKVDTLELKPLREPPFKLEKRVIK